MKQFVVTKDHSKTPLCGCLYKMTAENEEYSLEWFYDGDYPEDRRTQSLRNSGFVVELKAKNEDGLDVLYVPGTEPVIKVPNDGAVRLSAASAMCEKLQAAEDAANLAVSFMQTYI